jgi:hypothetical protein
LSVNTRALRSPHLVKPSALPQTLLTVSAICLFSVILTGAPVDVVFIVVDDAKDFASKINAGFSDD